MLTTLLASFAVAASLAEGPPPPITVSFNDGGQYSRGEYAQVQFRAAADGYVLLLRADQDGRIRVLFPLDPGDDNFIRGGKTYKVVGRDDRGAFYLDQAGGSGMVYAAWSKSQFRFAEFVRADHWDYTVFDQYNAAEDPESQLTDLVLRFTDQGFDYAVDRYIVYSVADYVSETPTTYIGVSGWPWPTYYTGGWSIGIGFGFGCCYDPWYGYGWGYPVYGWGYPAYGWGYPAYGWGYPGYGWGYPGYGYPGYGYGYPGYGYPGYHPGYPVYPGGGYAGYRPYTFKPGGTVTSPGNPYRPRGDNFQPQSAVFQSTYRDRPAYGVTGADRARTDAATVTGRADAGRRPTARPAPNVESGRTGAPASGATRRPTAAGTGGAAAGAGAGGARRSPSGQAAPSTRTRSEPSNAGGASRARGWSSDGSARPSTGDRPRISPSAPGSGRSANPTSRGAPGSRSGGVTAPSPRTGSGGGQPSAQPQGRSSGGSPSVRSGGGGGGSRPSGGGGARPSSGGGGGGGRGSAAPSGGGGGGGRRGR